MILGVVSDECYSETFLEVLQAIHNSFSIIVSIYPDESSTSSKDHVINSFFFSKNSG